MNEKFNKMEDFPLIAKEDKMGSEKNLKIIKEELAESLEKENPENIPGYENLVKRINEMHKRGLINDFWKDGYLEHLKKYSKDRFKKFAQETAEGMIKELDQIEASAKEKSTAK